MVKGIPIFKVTLTEGLFNQDINSDKLFAYAIEANKGPIGEPIHVSSAEEAMRIFGVNFAPHFYQGGSGLVLYRVAFKDATAPSLIYKAYTTDYTVEQLNSIAPENRETVDVLKITATTPGTPKHKVNLCQSITNANAYNLTVTIEGVGSKKYQNISSLANVVKRINSKFAEYIQAELLVDEDELKNNGYKPSRLFYSQDEQGNVIDTLSGGSNGKMLKTDGTISDIEIPENGLEIVPGYTLATVLTNTVEEFVGKQFYVSENALADNTSVYPLYTDAGETEAGIYIKIAPSSENGASYAFTSYADAEGTQEWASGTVATVGAGLQDANPATTLLYAYRDAFEALEDIDLLGVATLSNAEVVQNELIAHIEKLIDPEVDWFLKIPR